MYEIALKVLFSKAERFLIRNQHKPFVLTKDDLKASDGSDDDSSEWEPEFLDEENTDTPYFKSLCQGTYSGKARPQAQESIAEEE